MPRYFFDITDQGRGEPDDEGTVCADPEAASEEAIRTLAFMARYDLLNGNAHDFMASVRDESGKVFFKASLCLRAAWLG